MDVPPQFQLLTALVIGVLVALGAAYKFFRDLNAPDDKGGQINLLGAALNDSMALKDIANELREIRMLMRIYQERDQTGALANAIVGLTAATKAKNRLAH